MARKFWFVLLVFLAQPLVSPAQAANALCNNSMTGVDCVPRIGTVAAVQSAADLSGDAYTSFYLVSYGSGSTITDGDGAAGLFVRDNNRNGGGCQKNFDDGGSVLVDNHTASYDCFYRQNLNGDLRQWGLTINSDYDVTYAINHSTLTTLKSATPVIELAVTGLKNAGILALHTSQVSLKIDLDPTTHQPLEMLPGSSLSCDATPVKSADKANFTKLPGSLVFVHNAYIDAQTNGDVEIAHCAVIIPEWYINPSVASSWTGGVSSFSVPSNGYSDLDAIRTNMITAGDTPILAGAGARIHDLSIFGFDNCLHVTNAPSFLGEHISADCSTGFFMENTGGAATLRDLDNDPFLVKQAKTPAEEFWNIASITADASANGECQLKLTAGTTSFPLTDIANSGTNNGLSPPGRGDPYSFPAWVSGIGGATMSCSSASTGRFGNDAAWAVHNLDQTHISSGYVLVDLLGSKYTSSKLTGVGVSTQGDWQANNGVIHITGSIANLAPGMVADGSGGTGWPSGSQVIVQAVLQRCTGPDPNDGYNGCVIVAPAPTASASGVTITFYSQVDTVTGLTCDGTGLRPCFFYDASPRFIASTATTAGAESARLPTARGGSFGAGVFLDNLAGLRTDNIFTFSHYYNVAAIDSETCDFAQLKGDGISELDPAGTVGVYLSGSSRGCTFVAEGSGNKPGSGVVSDTYTTTDGSKTQATVSDVDALGKFGTTASTSHFVTVLSVTGFAARGVAHLCSALLGAGSCDSSQANEFVDESVSGSTLSINERGRFGTAPLDWSTACGGGVCSNIYAFPVAIGGGVSGSRPDRTDASIFTDVDDPTTTASSNQFEIHHGAAVLNGLHTNGSGVGFVSSNTAGVSISGANENLTSVYFENDNARILTTTSPDSSFANYVPQGAINQPQSYFQWFGSPQVSVGGSSGSWSAVGSNGVGPITVQDTTNWPQTGILLADTEYVGFHIVVGSTNLISVDQRGLCGSTPASHTDNVTVASYMNVLYGCPTGTLSAPQLTMDAAGVMNFAQAPLAHGQVYMSLNGTNIQLCPHNGRGLNISGVLRAVPPCAIAPSSSATNGFNYVYAQFHQFAVTQIANSTTHPGHPRLTFASSTSSLPDFYQGSPITCYGIGGQTEANVVDDTSTVPGTGILGPFVDITNQAFSSTPGPGTNTGICTYVSLRFDITGHSTAPNGVEVLGSPTPTDLSQTLVGAVYVVSGSIMDGATQRDVASWFNPQLKPCIKSLSSTLTSLSSSTYTELSSALECNFVQLGQNNTPWAVNGSAVGSASGTTVFTAVRFDSATHEAEISEGSGTNLFPITTTGLTQTPLTEGRHLITILYMTSGGGTASYEQNSSVEARLLQ